VFSLGPNLIRSQAHCRQRARESVRRASGFVQTGLWEVIAMIPDWCANRNLLQPCLLGRVHPDQANPVFALNL